LYYIIIIRMIKSRRMRWVGHVARIGEKRDAYSLVGGVLVSLICIRVGKPEGNRRMGRPRRRWVDSVKMDLREIGWDGMD
jgi:hypothetical protein